MVRAPPAPAAHPSTNSPAPRRVHRCLPRRDEGEAEVLGGECASAADDDTGLGESFRNLAFPGTISNLCVKQYFYTKTRNYRILFGSLREGAKTGLTLGAATALYVLSEEGVRTARNRLGLTQGISFGQHGAGPTDEGVPPATTIPAVGLEWLDGGVAGTILGSVISIFSMSSLHTCPRTYQPPFADRFPAPLFARTVLLGTTFGALEGCLRIAQDKIGRLKEEEERQRTEEEARVVVVDGAGKEGLPVVGV
jgi:hypothetical protein